MKENDVYKGFRVLSVSDVRDFASTAIYLRHEESGLEVFKLLNDDSENSFAFAFRTPCENSTGVAHAIEHSVLCGSERYPLKDPFISLENQSVNTYLNAYTCPEHTVYPSSSPVKADFYNIFSVYADAVFFPLLKEGAFLQECHRMELDKDGKPCIQGVVYNEMKGNYASFEDVAYDLINRPLMEGSEYVYDSGGDPLVIPSLSYEAFRDYHRRYYCTANCLCYLYGNIPLEEELDFLVEHVTSRISSPGSRASYPDPDFSRPVAGRVKAFAPAGEGGEDSRRVVAMNWRISDGIEKEDLLSFNMQFSFLSELLWGDDSAPVSKLMLDAKIGDAIAPYTGFSSSGRFPTLCFSMNGVKEGDEEKFRSLLLNILRGLADKGISDGDFDRTAMTFDFSNREIRRPGGSPFSLILMRRAVKSWIFGFPPDKALSYREESESLKKRIKAEPALLPGLIEKYFLGNARCSLVSVDPSAEWEEDRAAKELELTKREFESMGKDRLLAGLETMRAFQNSDDDDSCLPHLRLADLPRKLDKILMDEETAGGVPFFVSKEPTNGITYFDIGFPFDTLDPEDYLYVSTLSSMVGQIGFKGCPWDQVMNRIGAVSGGFGADSRTFMTDGVTREKLSGSPYLERDMFFIRFKCLDEKLADNLDLLSSCLGEMDFGDSKRLSDLLAANANEAKASVLPDAHHYAMYRSARRRKPKLAVKEILQGLTAVVFACKAKDMDVKLLSSRLESVYRKILSGGAVIHVTAEEPQIARIRPAVEAFVARNSLKPLGPRPAMTAERAASLLKLTEFEGSQPSGVGAEKTIDEIFIIPGTVAFDSKCCESSPFYTKEAMAEVVFAHCLSMTDLWDKVRTKGGAYGAFFIPQALSESSYFVTYRDPKPFLSLSALTESMDAEETACFTDEEVEKAITGCYSSEIAPETPSGRGAAGFRWLFTGGSNEARERRVGFLLGVSKEDLRASCLRYREHLAKDSSVVILCPKSIIDDKVSESTGKIIVLPL